MKPGQRVMLICRCPSYTANGYPMPPVGNLGTIDSELDKFGEYDVWFDNYPCPVGLDPRWVTHWSHIVPIDLHDEEITKQANLSIPVILD